LTLSILEYIYIYLKKKKQNNYVNSLFLLNDGIVHQRTLVLVYFSQNYF